MLFLPRHSLINRNTPPKRNSRAYTYIYLQFCEFIAKSDIYYIAKVYVYISNGMVIKRDMIRWWKLQSAIVFNLYYNLLLLTSVSRVCIYVHVACECVSRLVRRALVGMYRYCLQYIQHFLFYFFSLCISFVLRLNLSKLKIPLLNLCPV